jgi:hypothetical protein
MNRGGLPLRNAHTIGRSLTLSKTIAALSIQNEEGNPRPGLISQLRARTILQICGPGFNDRTVEIEAQLRQYFVFWEDFQGSTLNHLAGGHRLMRRSETAHWNITA